MNILITAIYWALPALIANGTPVILGGGTPIDFGKMWRGKRILGDGKTIRGGVAGIILGSLVGLMQGVVVLGFLLATGAILGDMIGSFFKRRLDLKRGHPFLLVDQLLFIVVALLLASLVEVPPTNVIIVILLATPMIHLGSNYIAYKLGLKKVWW